MILLNYRIFTEFWSLGFIVICANSYFLLRPTMGLDCEHRSCAFEEDCLLCQMLTNGTPCYKVDKNIPPGVIIQLDGLSHNQFTDAFEAFTRILIHIAFDHCIRITYPCKVHSIYSCACQNIASTNDTFLNVFTAVDVTSSEVTKPMITNETGKSQISIPQDVLEASFLIPRSQRLLVNALEQDSGINVTFVQVQIHDIKTNNGTAPHPGGIMGMINMLMHLPLWMLGAIVGGTVLIIGGVIGLVVYFIKRRPRKVTACEQNKTEDAVGDKPEEIA